MMRLFDKAFFLRRKVNLILLFIIIISAFLRLYNLGINPPAAYGDEISFAWNAWNILKSGTDEYGNAYPLQFRAFDDFKSPIPVYLLVPFLGLFGLNTFIVRLPVALFSVLTIFIFYFLGRKIFDYDKSNFLKSNSTKAEEKFALLSTLLLSITPWHLHLSRGYFEATIALCFLMLAVYLFVLAKNNSKFMILSALFFVCTLYTYFTPRIVLLFLIPFMIFWARDWVFKKLRYLISFIAIIGLLAIPLVKLSYFDSGLSRMNKLFVSRNDQIVKSVEQNRNSVNSPLIIKKLLHNRPLYWARSIIYDYTEHFSLNFLFIYGDSSLRYGLGNIGMLFFVLWPFFIIGFPVLFIFHRKMFWLLSGWLMISPIPAALVGRPFAVRSLGMAPIIVYISSFGIYASLVYIKSHGRLFNFIFKVSFGVGIFIGSSYYLIRYHLEYPSYAATWWGWENKTAIEMALKESTKYDHIFLSNFYSGIDLAFAYYTAIDPIEYRKAKQNHKYLADNREQLQLGKFYIGSLDIDEKRQKQNLIPANTLYIGRPEEADSPETINDPGDGRILFKIYRTN